MLLTFDESNLSDGVAFPEADRQNAAQPRLHRLLIVFLAQAVQTKGAVVDRMRIQPSEIHFITGDDDDDDDDYDDDVDDDNNNKKQ